MRRIKKERSDTNKFHIDILDKCIMTWSDVEIGYFLYNYSDSNKRDTMANELGLSSDELYSMYAEVLNEYRRRRDKNL